MIKFLLLLVVFADAQWNLISGDGAPVLSTAPNAKIAPIAGNVGAMWCLETDMYILNGPYLWKYETQTTRWLWQPNPTIDIGDVVGYWSIRNDLWVLGSNGMFKYAVKTRVWAAIPPAPQGNGQVAQWTHEYSNRLYLYSGQTLSAFDVSSLTWQTISQSNSGPIAQNVSAVLGNSEDSVYLYVNDKVWRLSLATFGWQEMGASGPPGPNRIQYALWRQGDNLILFGGQSGSKVFDDTWKYDTKADKWQQITSGTPYARYGSLTCPDGYLFGSQGSDHNDLWVYGAAPATATVITLFPNGAILVAAIASCISLVLMVFVAMIACIQCCRKRASLQKADEFINV